MDAPGHIVGTIDPGNGHPGTASIYIDTPAGGGNFDMRCQLWSTTGVGTQHLYSALNFSTDYALAMTADISSVTAVTGKFLLNAGSVLAGDADPVNMVATAFAATGGYIARGGEFNRYHGILGKVYYYAEGLGVLLSNSDLSNINTNGPSVIGGYPTTGGFLSRNFWWDNL